MEGSSAAKPMLCQSQLWAVPIDAILALPEDAATDLTTATSPTLTDAAAGIDVRFIA